MGFSWWQSNCSLAVLPSLSFPLPSRWFLGITFQINCFRSHLFSQVFWGDPAQGKFLPESRHWAWCSRNIMMHQWEPLGVKCVQECQHEHVQYFIFLSFKSYWISLSLTFSLFLTHTHTLHSSPDDYYIQWYGGVSWLIRADCQLAHKRRYIFRDFSSSSLNIAIIKKLII